MDNFEQHRENYDATSLKQEIGIEKKLDVDKAVSHLKRIIDNKPDISHNGLPDWSTATTIYSIQALLKDKGYYNGKFDGILKNSGTIEAIKKFQKDSGIAPVDGIPTIVTLKELLSNYGYEPLKHGEAAAMGDKTSITDVEIKWIIKYYEKNKLEGYVYDSMVNLSSLTTITDRQAELLSKIEFVLLPGLKEISDKQAESLSKVKFLSLRGLSKITDKQAESLSKNTFLSLSGLTKITDQQAKFLSNVETLILNGLTKITDQQAKFLSNVETLMLDGVTKITDQQAKFLSNVDNITLSGLEGITDSQAKSLSKSKKLILNPRILTSKQAEILKDKVDKKAFEYHQLFESSIF